MAKNSEVYKTAQERAEAFEKFCAKRCEDCSLYKLHITNHCMGCAFAWLDLEAEEEKLQPCYMCGSNRVTSYKADVGYSLICRDCGYCAGTRDTREEIEALHNRIAKACGGYVK